MVIQIPERVKIGGIVYEVKVVDNDQLPDAGGTIDTDRKLIRLLKSAEDYMQASFLHEILHAVNMEMPEERVEFLAQALFQIFTDNPQLLAGGDKHGRTKKR